jgi:hypothetical protein
MFVIDCGSTGQFPQKELEQSSMVRNKRRSKERKAEDEETHV